MALPHGYGFAYPARRSTSSLVRRRARVYSPTAKFPRKHHSSGAFLFCASSVIEHSTNTLCVFRAMGSNPCLAVSPSETLQGEADSRTGGSLEGVLFVLMRLRRDRPTLKIADFQDMGSKHCSAASPREALQSGANSRTKIPSGSMPSGFFFVASNLLQDKHTPRCQKIDFPQKLRYNKLT